MSWYSVDLWIDYPSITSRLRKGKCALVKNPIDNKKAPPPWKHFTRFDGISQHEWSFQGLSNGVLLAFWIIHAVECHQILWSASTGAVLFCYYRARAFQQCIAGVLNHSCCEMPSNLVKCFHGSVLFCYLCGFDSTSRNWILELSIHALPTKALHCVLKHWGSESFWEFDMRFSRLVNFK